MSAGGEIGQKIEAFISFGKSTVFYLFIFSQFWSLNMRHLIDIIFI